MEHTLGEFVFEVPEPWRAKRMGGNGLGLRHPDMDVSVNMLPRDAALLDALFDATVKSWLKLCRTPQTAVKGGTPGKSFTLVQRFDDGTFYGQLVLRGAAAILTIACEGPGGPVVEQVFGAITSSAERGGPISP